MFDNVGWPELLVLALVGLFVLGPERLPAAAAWVASAPISTSPYRYVARIRFEASEDTLRQHFSDASAVIEPDGEQACIVTAGADDPERMAVYFAMVGIDFRVLEPQEVADAARVVADRLRRATR